MKNPSWSPDGTRIAFDGNESGFNDIYIYEIETKKLARLMDDRYDDNDPSWSPDGRYLTYASDRPDVLEDASTYVYGEYDIFLYDTDGGWTTRPVDSPYRDQQPVFSPDGNRIAFVSNRNGIDNIYLYEMGSGEIFPITNIISGAFSPSWSPDGDQLAFSAFFNYGFDIYILKDIKNVGDENNELTLTSYMNKIRAGETNIFVPADATVPDTVVVEADTAAGTSGDFSTYVFRAGEEQIREEIGELPTDTARVAEEDTTLAAADTLEYLLPDGTYKRNRYKLKLSPELVTGGFSYDNFYGLQGQSYLSISDLFGNHHFYIFTDLVNTIDQSNIQLAYLYSAKRIDYAASIFHFKNLYYNDFNDFFFSDRVYGAQGYVTYPFSRFTRFDLQATQVTVSRENFAPVDSFPDRTTNILFGSAQFVNDAVIWGLTGPVAGQRYMVRFDQSLKAVGSGLDFRSVEFDFRKYWFFWSRYNFAFRAGGGLSGGKDAKVYYIGGTANWIGPSQAKQDIYGVNDIYINEIVVPVRGYKYFSDSGNRYGIVNLEFRYPFIDYFRLHFPLPITLAQVSGAIFWDMAATWNRDEDGSFSDNLRLYDPRSQEPPRGGDVLAGFGFGPRVNLGIFVLRVDLAWGTDLSNTSPKPQWYFSFGAEF
jgi:hypothetical protein